MLELCEAAAPSWMNSNVNPEPEKSSNPTPQGQNDGVDNPIMGSFDQKKRSDRYYKYIYIVQVK